MKTPESEEIVRFEARVMRPVSKFPETKSFDCFAKAADFLQGIYRGMTENHVPDKMIEKSENSMVIVRKVYANQANYSKGFTMTESPVWSGAMHGMQGIGDKVKHFRARESAALFKDNLFVNGDNEQSLLRQFAVIKCVSDDTVKVAVHFNGKKSSAEYSKEDFLNRFHKADPIAHKQFKAELKRYKELHADLAH